MPRSVRTSMLACVAILSFAVAGSPAAAQQRQFDVPAQSAATSVPAFARQAGLQIIAPGRSLKGVRTAALRGTYDVRAALAAMLRGTGLVIVADEGRTITLGPSLEPRQDDVGETGESAAIVVTGSRIRNIEAIALPLTTYTRQDIEQSTRTDVSGFLQILPQNFSGGSLPLTPDGAFGSGSGRFIAKSGATGPNLRGLGAGSTLTLVNGHRVASGANGAFVDIGLIPVSIIKRIDIVTDGASAVYGSDAVGGVVNVILSDDFDHVATSLVHEFDNAGTYGNLDLSQSVGTDWGSGGVLVAGRYRHRDDLDTQDRPFSRDILVYNRDGVTISPQLYPRQDEYSAFATARQTLGSGIELRTDGWYNRRNHDQAFGNLSSLLVADTRSEQFSANGALKADVAGISVDLSGGHSFSHDRITQDNYSRTSGRNFAVRTRNDFDLTYANLNASGDIVRLPGGALSFALGGEHRQENYVANQAGFSGVGLRNPVSSSLDLSRNIDSAYGELLVPLIGQANQGAFLRRAALSLAGRYDSYSDVGDTWNGKVGLTVGLGSSVTLRGTYSTSFRAPTLVDTARAGITNIFLDTTSYASPDRAGQTARVIEIDGTAQLKPETARIVTAGIDVAPASIPGLHASLTFFDYDYRDRLALPAFDPNFLLQPQVFGALFRRVASVAEIQQTLADATASGGTVFDPFVPAPISSYEYILDRRFRNISSENVRGLDLELRHRFTVSDLRLGTHIAATYLLHDRRKVTAESVATDFIGLFGELPDFRLRGDLTAEAGNFGATAAVNYVSGFENTNLLARPPIDAFVTADLDLRYRFERGALGGRTTLSFGIRNLFDRSPPFVERSAGNPDYDPANANPLGRVFLIRLSQDW